MKTIVRKLKHNLTDQLNYYKVMEQLTIEKKDLIIKGDADALAELDKTIEAVACQALGLEQDRLSLLGGVANRSSKLSDFIKMIGPELGSPLEELRTQLMEVMANIQRVNNMNIYLIKSSIKWIEHSVTTIANVLAPECSAYNRAGKAMTTSPYNMNKSSLVEHEA